MNKRELEKKIEYLEEEWEARLSRLETTNEEFFIKSEEDGFYLSRDMIEEGICTVGPDGGGKFYRLLEYLGIEYAKEEGYRKISKKK